jgi:glycerol-3-phosphate O-acyltransferase/dihydroxyacetone phosphate acyltransferase
LICSILRFALRVFFRKIEVAGVEHVPRDKPVIFVLNHPNGLVDPVFMLCLSGRKVSFLAKEPLFRMPVIGFLVRALDALPVYRKQDDGADTSRNLQTFDAARKLLLRGGAIAICPEGVSHDEPRLKPIKSGAARIAIGAASGGESLDLKIIPAGLYYTAKTTFRSSALLFFGEPLPVEPALLDDNGEPLREVVAALSDRIEGALREVMLHAEHEEALAIISRAERIFTSELPVDDDQTSLARELELRKLFLSGYTLLHAHAPEKLATLDSRLRRYEEQLAQLDLEPREVERPRSALKESTLLVLAMSLFVVLTPIAMLGLLIHYPAYRLSGYIATRLSKTSEDVVSTIKIVAAMLFFPLTWIIVAVAMYLLIGWRELIASLLLVPFSGYLAMRFFEELDRFVGDVRSLMFYFTRRRYFLRLVAEKRAIFDEITVMGKVARELAENKA